MKALTIVGVCLALTGCADESIETFVSRTPLDGRLTVADQAPLEVGLELQLTWTQSSPDSESPSAGQASYRLEVQGYGYHGSMIPHASTHVSFALSASELVALNQGQMVVLERFDSALVYPSAQDQLLSRPLQAAAVSLASNGALSLQLALGEARISYPLEGLKPEAAEVEALLHGPFKLTCRTLVPLTPASGDAYEVEIQEDVNLRSEPCQQMVQAAGLGAWVP